nr:MAG TPA: hypothetical protein [Caudoviricetes sp.]
MRASFLALSLISHHLPDSLPLAARYTPMPVAFLPP